MKMKMKIISILITGVMILSVGCGSKNNSESDNKISSQENEQVSKYTNEEIYGKHEELLDKIKKGFNDYGITEIKEDYEIDNKYYKGTTRLLYHNSQIKNDIYFSEYKLVKEGENAKYIYLDSFMNVNKDEISNNGFNVEGTFFEKMTKIMHDGEVDYKTINEDIVNAYKNNEFMDETYDYDDMNIRVVADGDALSYTIKLYK